MNYYSSILFRKRSKPIFSLLQNLTFTRSMGGGPRTFPGGLNKWQWKRLHEKKAQEKEKKLLHQEKQLYQARIRSQIRSKLSPQQQPDPNPSNYTPLSPENHIKALADRFMKEGAEDLWNEADGPVNIPPEKAPVMTGLPGEPLNLRKLVFDNRGNSISVDIKNGSNCRNYCTDAGIRVWVKFKSKSSFGNSHLTDVNNSLNFCNYLACSRNKLNSGINLMGYGEGGISSHLNNFIEFRNYSVNMRIKNRSSRFNFRRNNSSDSEDDDTESESDLVGPSSGNVRWPRFGSHGAKSSDDGDEDEEGMGRSRGNVKKMMSSAALGKYDMKTTKRVPLKFLEEEDDLSQHMEAIRKEVNKRSLEENVGEKSDEESILSDKRFDECNVSRLTVKALNAAGYMQMTRVQEATLSACLEGQDSLVKAKTGTGKSAAFLLPAIETVLKAASSNSVQRVPPIYVLILCPTRELASQIAAEANVMLKYHDGIGVQSLVGGTRFKLDQKRLESDPCQIIVATPGRLLDHIENKSGFSVRLMGLRMLILDEADLLLDLGFRKDMEKIVDCLPRQRQSLLFSATLPKEVRRISQLVLKREHAYIDTVGFGCLETHAKVKQSYLVAPHDQHFQIVYHILKGHISEVVDYKVIVFCTTAMMTSLMFFLFREMKMNVREIHTRKTQLYRTRVSEEFRQSKRSILITSDVSARGMNYPDVTLVIQVAIPSDREQYIHRLGRTGREGKGGQGILLLAPWEEYFLDEIKDLPLEKFALLPLDPAVKVKLENSLTKIDTSVKEAAYHAWLGYYNSIREICRDKTTLVQQANKFCESIGLQKPPTLFRKTALKMGLKDIPGIRIRK